MNIGGAGLQGVEVGDKGAVFQHQIAAVISIWVIYQNGHHVTVVPPVAATHRYHGAVDLERYGVAGSFYVPAFDGDVEGAVKVKAASYYIPENMVGNIPSPEHPPFMQSRAGIIVFHTALFHQPTVAVAALTEQIAGRRATTKDHKFNHHGVAVVSSYHAVSEVLQVKPFQPYTCLSHS
jgi:hypothetical protein